MGRFHRQESINKRGLGEMKIERLRVYDLEESLIASGYPMRTELPSRHADEKDIKRIMNLTKASNGNGAHGQALTGIRVAFDLTCTNKMWVEAERYRFLEFVSSQSTMHRITKFELDKQYCEYVDPRVIAIMKEKVAIYNDLLECSKIWPEHMTEEELEQQELLDYFTKEELETLSEEEIEELLEKRKNEMPVDTAQYQPTDIGYYLQQIPFTVKQKEDANEMILQALNNIGYIYYDNLQDYKNSIDAYTELNNRYPANEYELTSWYYLFKMYNERKEYDKAEYYKIMD